MKYLLDIPFSCGVIWSALFVVFSFLFVIFASVWSTKKFLSVKTSCYYFNPTLWTGSFKCFDLPVLNRQVSLIPGYWNRRRLIGGDSPRVSWLLPVALLPTFLGKKIHHIPRSSCLAQQIYCYQARLPSFCLTLLAHSGPSFSLPLPLFLHW